MYLFIYLSIYFHIHIYIHVYLFMHVGRYVYIYIYIYIVHAFEVWGPSQVDRYGHTSVALAANGGHASSLRQLIQAPVPSNLRVHKDTHTRHPPIERNSTFFDRPLGSM